jgi:hypothetical protein
LGNVKAMGKLAGSLGNDVADSNDLATWITLPARYVGNLSPPARTKYSYP